MSGEVYPNAPLALVAFEVRYPEQPSLASRPTLDKVKKALADWLPLRDNLSQHQVMVRVGAEEPASVHASVVPRFTSRDRTTACLVASRNLILETTVYGGFDSFSRLLEKSMEAVALNARPDGVTRLGLRYIDEIRVPGIETAPGNWHGYINEHLLAPVEEGFVQSAGVTPRTWQGIVQYGTGVDRTVVLRYGPAEGYAVLPNGPTRRKNFPPTGLFFLLDFDSYWEPTEEVPEFDPLRILEISKELHAPTKALFDAVVTDKLREEVFRRISEGGGD